MRGVPPLLLAGSRLGCVVPDGVTLEADGADLVGCPAGALPFSDDLIASCSSDL
jgi:hypothetical protein